MVIIGQSLLEQLQLTSVFPLHGACCSQLWRLCIHLCLAKEIGEAERQPTKKKHDKTDNLNWMQPQPFGTYGSWLPMHRVENHLKMRRHENAWSRYKPITANVWIDIIAPMPWGHWIIKWCWKDTSSASLHWLPWLRWKMGRFDCDAARAVPVSLEVMLLCAYVAREFKRIVLEATLFTWFIQGVGWEYSCSH